MGISFDLIGFVVFIIVLTASVISTRSRSTGPSTGGLHLVVLTVCRLSV